MSTHHVGRGHLVDHGSYRISLLTTLASIAEVVVEDVGQLVENGPDNEHHGILDLIA